MVRVAALVLVCAMPAWADLIRVAGGGAGAVRLVVPDDSELESVALDMMDYLRARGLAYGPDLFRAVEGECAAPQWVFVTAANGGVPGADVPDFPADARDEAFCLSVDANGTSPVVRLAGKTVAGLRAASRRLMGKFVNDGEGLLVTEGREQRDPFVQWRLLCVCPSARRQTPFTSPYKDADFETWTAQRIRRYPRMFAQFGFNGVQIAEIRGYGSCCGQDVTDERLPRIRRAVQSIARGAKDQDLMVSQFQWGDCLYAEGHAFSWNNPKERAEMRGYMRDQAQSYGELVDHINVHIGDPGGCTRDGCDHYKTPQEVTHAWLKAYREVNPQVVGTLSTWANGFFWKHSPEPVDMGNYPPFFGWMVEQQPFGQPIPGDATFLDDTFMPAEIGIALNRRYNQDQAERLHAAGRPVDVWNWYTSDFETINNIWINRKVVADVFGSLPNAARHLLRSHTTEICFHGWPNVINTYTAAQLMWDPRRSLDDIEREFCTAAFGPGNADAMVALYRACSNWDGNLKLIPQPADFGTQSYNDRIGAIIADAQRITIDPSFVPNFHFPVPVARYVEMMTARARLIRAVSQAKQRIDAKRAELGVTKSAEAAVRGLCFCVYDNQSVAVIPQPPAEVPIPLEPGQTMGQTFRAMKDFVNVSVRCPTWGSADSGLTISLYDRPGGNRLASQVITDHPDNGLATVRSQQSAGTYYVEISNPTGTKIGVYGTNSPAQKEGELYLNGQRIGADHPDIAELKREAIENLPVLPIDPLWPRQTSDVVHPSWRGMSFAAMIERL